MPRAKQFCCRSCHHSRCHYPRLRFFTNSRAPSRDLDRCTHTSTGADHSQACVDCHRRYYRDRDSDDSRTATASYQSAKKKRAAVITSLSATEVSTQSALNAQSSSSSSLSSSSSSPALSLRIGCVGLVNVGNTCYFNVMIQALFHTEHFRHSVLTSPRSLYGPSATLQQLFLNMADMIC